MPHPTITTSVRTINDRTSVIELRGEVTGFAEDELMAAYNRASDGRSAHIILNFAGLEYMNSSGIGLLVTLLIRAQRQKQRLHAVGLSDHYRQIFELTRLDDAIPIYGSEAEAIAGIQGT
jgi:anti-sigma B factor antagonist